MKRAWTGLSKILLVCLVCLPSAAVAGGDAFKPSGGVWDPFSDGYSRQVFDSFDSSAVPVHSKLPFEDIAPSDRPPLHRQFLIAFAISIGLFVPIALFTAIRRKRPRQTGQSRVPLPDDLVWVGPAMLLGLVLRLVAVFRLPLHGSEWGSVELGFSIPDVLFNGYEVLTNPPLLNFVEHFVFKACVSPVCFRIPPVVAGMLLIWAARTSARELGGRRAGIAAAFLAAINCGLIVWSATMRAYLPMAAFVVAALPAVIRIAAGRDRGRDSFSLAIFGALAVWTHYIAWIWLLLYAIWIVAANLRNPRRLAGPALAAIFVVISFLPLVPFFIDSFGDKQGSLLPPGWGRDMLALATGMPGPVGFIVPAGLIAARFYRSPREIRLVALIFGYVGICIATSGMIFWELSYSVGLSAFVTILIAVVVARQRRFALWVSTAAVLMLSTCVLVAMEPVDSPVVAGMNRPFLWRSVSAGLFSRTILDSAGPDVLLVTPAYESESFLYHMGPVTPEQAGVTPVVVRNFDEMVIPAGPGRSEKTVIGFERYWSWHLGQWPELERYTDRFGAFWYARMQQNCENESGMTYSGFDCRWLRLNCERAGSTAFDELYLCRPGAAPGQP